MSSTDLGRALCIITGASRGFGRAVAVQLSRLVKPGSVLLLAARSGDELRALQEELAGSEAGRTGVKAVCVEADLGQKEGPERVLKAAAEASSEEIEHLILINNAASLGDVSRFCKDFTNMADMDSYLSFNFSSCLCLTAGVLQRFPKRPGLKRTVVNVSSVCALQPFSSWVLYCSGKAARHMMFKVLAQEEPDLRVLSYGPGPMGTAMLDEGRFRTADPALKNFISGIYTEEKLITCEESSSKMMKLLLKDEYTSGDQISVYDV
ncbi:sepiapterin reductase-like [Notolabrus celidotus]|uniref:sepiapterin reductase-like n=1 Tax=Notolabrus celidotus TaxID=1203425 RepID=UPI00148F992C|nr:sepiapterin reductase-like [Notolabrus celidotus]